MPFKINVSHNGKTYKIETEDETLVGKSIGDNVNGKEIAPELDGYELEVSGGSDKAGFPMYSKVEGIGLKRVLFSRGFGMKNKQKGLRLRKTVRGNTISNAIVQINLKVVKEGSKKFDEITAPAPEAPAEGGEKPAEASKEETKAEEKKEEAPKEEAKAEEKKE